MIYDNFDTLLLIFIINSRSINILHNENRNITQNLITPRIVERPNCF